MSDVDAAKRALALLDLTDLGEPATEEGLHALCRSALSGPVKVAAICIWPHFVARARAILSAEPLLVATVVNFPAGDGDAATVMGEIDDALEAGADEIDLVMPWRAFLAGDHRHAGAMIEQARTRVGTATLKVILETGEYPGLDRVEAAAKLAIAAGADFIKTSTGKTARSASPEAVRAMLGVIADAGRPIGLKPSGGIRSLSDARLYLALVDAIMGPAWATPSTFRFGASGLHQVLLDTIAGKAAGSGLGEANGRY